MNVKQAIHSVYGVLGRNWSTADYSEVKDFGDCARVTLYWIDGEFLYYLTDSKADAVESLKQLGFVPRKTFPAI